jgi:hypothetical protein
MLSTSTTVSRVVGSDLRRRQTLSPSSLGTRIFDQLERLDAVVGELDHVPGVLEKIALEAADVRVALDDQDQRAARR